MASALALALGLMVMTSGHVLAVVNFELPFLCDETYRGSTYTEPPPPHPVGAIDFNKDDGSDVDDPVLASASGEVLHRIDANGEVHIAHGE